MIGQQPFNIQIGIPTSSGCPVTIVSLSSGDVTINCEGQIYTVSMTAKGTDRGSGPAQAGYIGSVTVAHSSNGIRNVPFSVSQNGNTITGSYRTPPAANEDFRTITLTCDNPTNFGGKSSGLWWYIWRAINQADGGLPLAAVNHVDDICYAAITQVNDAPFTGHSSTGQPSATKREYDYLLPYFLMMGLFGSTDTLTMRWGRDNYRVLCQRNVGIARQYGDWEFRSDEGFDRATDLTAGSQYNVGRAVWDYLYSNLKPGSAINTNDTNANHWAYTLGPVRFVAPDCIRNGGGTYVDGTTTINPFLGTNQITDILNACDTTDAFKVLLLSCGIRYAETPATAPESSYTQHPLFNHNLAEYKRLMTQVGATPKSLMDNSKTNGTSGILTTEHGDIHFAAVMRHFKAAYNDGVNDHAVESFYSVNSATVNGSTNFELSSATIGNPGYKYNNEVETVYMQSDAHYNEAHIIEDNWYGSKSSKELHRKIIRMDGRVVWSGLWVEGQGNLPVRKSLSVF